jgi:hypothetical protein
MPVRFIPLDAGQQFAIGRLDAIVAWLEEAAREVAPPVRAGRVDVIIVPSKHVVPGWDCNGFAHSAWLVTIGIDPTCDGREKRSLAAQLRAVLAHELHHAMRSRGLGYGSTLGEALISEGLSECYEEEVGCPTSNYALAVRGPALLTLARMARDQLWSEKYDHPKWFFGSRTDTSYPHWGGYSLGYVLVRGWLDRSRRSASSAVEVPAREILPGALDFATSATFDPRT